MSERYHNDGASRERREDELRDALDHAIEQDGRDALEALAGILLSQDHPAGDGDALNLQGARAGRWRLSKVIGMGGMGVTYAARDDSGGRAAIKVIGQMRANSSARFEAECDALQHLDCEGVVRYLGRGRVERNGAAYMAMEFIDGCNLERLIADVHEDTLNQIVEVFEARSGERFGVRQLVELIKAATLALEGVHRAGIVHRDVKPANIMVGIDLSVTLIDFGLSRDAFREQQLTCTAAPVGTLRYMAPEQARASAEADRRVDIYSLGRILAHAVGGVELVEISGDRGRPWRVPQVIVEAACKGVAAPLQAILYKSLQDQPRDRYRSAADLAADLDRYLKDEPVAASIPSRWQRLTRNPTVRYVASMMIAVMATAILVATALSAEPYLISIDTSNDGGTIKIDGLGTWVAPVFELEIEPGPHEIVYEAPWCATIRKRIVVDRHHMRINLRTIGQSLAQVEPGQGLLNIDTGSDEDQVFVDGRLIERSSRWIPVEPGWHELKAVGLISTEGGGHREVVEHQSVFVESGEIASSVMLPVRSRTLEADYRATLGDVQQVMKPTFEISLDDGVVFWMNDFRDHLGDAGDRVHMRTCITPVVVDRELTMHLIHRFPEPMTNIRVQWNQNAIGKAATLFTECRLGDGDWIPYESLDTHGKMAVNTSELPEGGVLTFEMRATMRLSQKPTGFSTIEMLWGYFDEHSHHDRTPAITLVADRVGD